MLPTCFKEAKEFLEGGRYTDHRPFKDGRRADHRLVRRGDDLAVRLYNTDIVTFLKTGDIEITTGGYHTVTSKRYINAHLPRGFSVVQRNGDFYLADHRKGWDEVKYVPFGLYQRLAISRRGKITAKD